MKSLYLSFFITSSLFGGVAIYEEDNRMEVSEAPRELQTLASSTASLIVKSFLIKDGDSYKLEAPTLLDLDNVCPEERYKDQPAASFCSGTLIGPDLILTASHCYRTSTICQQASWVFDYHASDDYKFSKKNIYQCKEILYQSFDLQKGHDFAVIKLDRKVKGRNPVQLGQAHQLNLFMPLILIGNPRGLPTKIADNGHVTHILNSLFMTNLDAFTGNSGSGVFNASNHELEGILSFGKDDYQEDTRRNCFASQIYPMKDGGEGVLGIGPVREFLNKNRRSRR